MEYVSSDTNVWIDFFTISRTSLPFLLPYTYIMNADAVQDELLSPPGFGDELVLKGLVPVDISEVEFKLAEAFGPRYPRLSIYDRIALAIAKIRQITLLTGDGALRKAALSEGVNILGTIGLLDQLYKGNYIEAKEYFYCLCELEKHNGQDVRLPQNELSCRIQQIRTIMVLPK